MVSMSRRQLLRATGKDGEGILTVLLEVLRKKSLEGCELLLEGLDDDDHGKIGLHAAAAERERQGDGLGQLLDSDEVDQV